MYDAEDRQWWYAGMRAISLALLRPQVAAGARILDAGCGTGRNLAEFAGWARPAGVDLSEEALRFCRQRGVPAARGRLQALPFPAGAFDAVTSFDVLYHRWIEDDAAAVAELVRVLRPGGLLLVTNRIGRDARLMPGKTCARAGPRSRGTAACSRS